MSAVLEAGSAAVPAARAKSPYIAGPLYDWAFFLLPPLLSVVVGALVAFSPWAHGSFALGGKRVTLMSLSIGALVNAHLVAVVARSHLNTDVFRRHPVRFVVVPIALYAAMMVSMWAVAIASVVVVFWDVYHSGLQTFGLGRIYDRNAGNDPRVGRRLDLALNLLLYAGPILGGATMLVHFRSFRAFAEVDALFFTQIPALMRSWQRTIAWSLLIGGGAFLAYYVFAYARLARQGYRVSFPKVFLLSTTGLCSIWVWGWNPWGQAFFIMNLFHAVQYMALVWWSEGKVLRRRLHVEGLRLGKPIAATAFLGATLAYGVWAEIGANGERALWCVTQVVALMHFFYDGFVWSVRKKQV
jgi:hypothetical protein